MIFQRLKWRQLQNRCPINITSIISQAYKFQLLTSLPPNPPGKDIPIFIQKALESRRALDMARLSLKIQIDPEHNIYVRHYEKAYQNMNENLGRADKRLDELEKEIRMMDMYRMNPLQKVITLIRDLLTMMDSLVYNPLITATNKYILFDPEEYNLGENTFYLKDKRLFAYFIFLYLYHTSDSIGAYTREETRIKQEIISNSPPNLPENIERTMISPSTGQIMMESFNDPFLNEEAENVI